MPTKRSTTKPEPTANAYAPDWADAASWLDFEVIEQYAVHGAAYADPAITLTACDRARKAFIEGDGEGFAGTIPGAVKLHVVCYNMMSLKDRGIYEEALLSAFVGCPVNNSSIAVSFMDTMFKAADRAKLLAAGDTLPDGDIFILYRGISGVGRERREKSGYSWTLDRAMAAWFAQRFDEYPNPTVLRADAKRSEILAYYHQRGEQEMIWKCRPKRVTYEQLSPEEMQHLYDEVIARRQAAAEAKNGPR